MRRALIVGIDDYPAAPLTGCVNDALALERVLARHHDGQPNFHCEVMTSPPITLSRAVLREKIYGLFDQPADVAYLHFSGHGTRNGLGGYMVTQDYCDFDLGIAMTEVLALANASPVHEVFISLDCCYSGAFGSLPEINDDRLVLSEGRSIITATRSGQASLEADGGGVFTSLLVEALEGGASGLLGEISAANIYAYIDNAMGAWDQRPLFKSNVSRFATLRQGPPRVDRALLRRIIKHFPLPAEPLELSPSYEPTALPNDPVKEACFADLQKLRDVGLLVPVGTVHMYDAAMNSKACELTTLGRYYWRLVNDGKV